jgi:hypothetical protein
MLLFLVIILAVLTILSLTGCFLFYKIALRNMYKAEYLEDYTLFAKEHIQQAYAYLRSLDDRQIFAKDDEVGVAFTEILEVLQKLNEVVQEDQGE